MTETELNLFFRQLKQSWIYSLDDWNRAESILQTTETELNLFFKWLKQSWIYSSDDWNRAESILQTTETELNLFFRRLKQSWIYSSDYLLRRSCTCETKIYRILWYVKGCNSISTTSWNGSKWNKPKQINEL